MKEFIFSSFLSSRLYIYLLTQQLYLSALKLSQIEHDYNMIVFSSKLTPLLCFLS